MDVVVSGHTNGIYICTVDGRLVTSAGAYGTRLTAIPLMLDRNLDAITAAITSVRALFANPAAMFVWAGLIALLGGFGLVTFLAGMLIAGPILGHATWHAYRDLVE